MDKKQANSLTSYEITFTLVGTVIGIYLLRAAGDVTKIAHQDGWISMLIGGIYPLYIVFIAIYIINKHPRDNILILSKKYLGSIIGNMLNVLFLLQFVFYLTFMISSIISMLNTYGISILSPFKTVLAIITIAAYASSKGIKTIAKINVIAFYLLLFIIILSLFPLKFGSILNMMPVGGSGILSILKGSSKSLQSYATVEILLLIHPFSQKGVSVKNAALKAVLIICIVYTWVIFITIYYMGIELIPHNIWPSISIYQSIHIPLINNFVTIFMFIWSIIFLKSISNQYYIVSLILSHQLSINMQKICLFIFPAILYLSLLFSHDPKYSEYFSKAAIYILIFNLSYVSIIALLIFLKQGRAKNSLKRHVEINP